MSAQVAGERVDRFCKTTRWFHWTFALSFLTMAATGAMLLLREELGLDPQRAHVLLQAHEITAVFFLSAPWLIGLSGDTRSWLRDLSESVRFSREDLTWLLVQPLALLRLVSLPPQDKLNAGQKLNALAIAVISGVSVASGIHLWRHPGAFVALMIHIGTLIAWLPAFAVHFFMAVINPTTRPALRGMLLGNVSRSWAEHHHAKWLAPRPGGPSGQ